MGRRGFQLYYLKKKSLENICKSTKRCWWYNTSERNPAYKIIYPGWHIMMMWCQIHEGDNTTKCYIIFSGLENDLTCFNWYFLVFPKFCFEYLVNKHYIIFSEQCLQKYIHVAAQSCLGVLTKHKLICIFLLSTTIYWISARHYGRFGEYSSKQMKVLHIATSIQVGEMDDK